MRRARWLQRNTPPHELKTAARQVCHRRVRRRTKAGMASPRPASANGLSAGTATGPPGEIGPSVFVKSNVWVIGSSSTVSYTMAVTWYEPTVASAVAVTAAAVGIGQHAVGGQHRSAGREEIDAHLRRVAAVPSR